MHVQKVKKTAPLGISTWYALGKQKETAKELFL